MAFERVRAVRVRITKTWHVDVPAEYGDTEASLKKKALESYEHVAPDEHVQVNLVRLSAVADMDDESESEKKP